MNTLSLMAKIRGRCACYTFRQLAIFGALTVFAPAVACCQRNALLGINDSSLVSRADLIYHQPVTRSEAGLPVGNGRMGSLVWTSPSALRLQINRVDIFGNNSASNNFYQRNTDYCGGAGFVDVDFGREVFTGKDFGQKLSCYDGLVTVEGKEVKAQVLTWNKQDVMAIRVDDKRTGARYVNIDLRMLRDPVAHRGNHSGVSKISVRHHHIVLTQQFKEDNYYCGSAVVIGVKGREVKAELADESTVRLMVAPGEHPFSIYIASAASFNSGENVADSAAKKLETAENEGYEKLLASNKTWWHQFWSKGFIQLHSADGVADDVEKNYTYYLYVMASSSRGKYPVKFNGMLWSTGGDTRQWGGLYWGANQSCLYNALFTSGRLSLMKPMFDMYSGMYDHLKLAARQEWGSKGVYIPETVGFDGPPKLPDSIAREMQALYLVQKSWDKRSSAFKHYAYTKLPYLSRWNWKKDGGWQDGRWKVLTKNNSTFGHTSHILSRGAKIAYQYWLRYEYTMDTAWLRKYAYPMIKGIAEFYRNFPNVKKERDGKYHIYHINDNESVWGGQNTVEEISSMRGIFPVAIKASEILKVDAAMRPVWQEFLDHLSSLPVSSDFPSSSRSPDKLTWIKALPPIQKGNGQGLPDSNTMPVWFFDLCNKGADTRMLNVANNTYDAYFKNGIHNDTRVGVLSRLPVAGILLGRVHATRYLIPNQIHTTEVNALPNRMDEREGHQTTNVERLGRAAEALEDALVQSVPPAPGKSPVIYVFPAWPKEWNAQFKLLCRGAFFITSAMQKGAIRFVKIKSEKGAVCNMSNPWPRKKVTLYRDGKAWKKLKGTLLSFDTHANGEYVITPNGVSLSRISHFTQRHK
ncbi:MAG TPA: DUF5703 domain-containing protein [Chitinophagaceae bacterium]|nr:DUF5703 domain-containing protein [Chitinophagaceae bacterium]